MTPAPSQTDRPTFLARKSFGHANYFLLALVAAFLVAFIPIGARRAADSNTNKAEDWLPKSYAESTDLAWFRDHFVGEQFAVVSWDGCTLGNTLKLAELSRKLLPSADAIVNSPANSDLSQRSRLYKRVVTGPSAIAELTAPPLSLDYATALKRIEGSLVGPVMRDARGKSLGDETRNTCLVVYLGLEATRDNRMMRQALEKIIAIATNECAIPISSIHMAGPSVDNVTIDVESQRSLGYLAALAGVLGFTLAYFCFQNLRVSAAVFAVGSLSAGLSLAVVFYFGIVEVTYFGAERPRLGTVDAILMTMPAVVYVLGLSGAVHMVNYYRNVRREKGVAGAAEKAAKLAWWPAALAAMITAIGLSTLATSDILPIKKFGLFTSISVVATVAILFLILPAFLHRFPLNEKLIKRTAPDQAQFPDWLANLFGLVVGRNVMACLLWLVVTGVFSLGFTKIGTSVQLLKLFDEKNDLIQDYAWLEKHVGNVVPMEMVITVPPERLRSADEHAEQDGKQYRMTMLERLDMIREIQFRVESFPEISRVMSAATFAPTGTDTGISAAADRSGDYAINKSLEDHRASLLSGDFLRLEQPPHSKLTSGRELWRLSARVAAIGDPRSKDNDIDYGQFVEQLKSAVDPVLVAYQQRDMIVESLHGQGKQLDGAQICILYRTPDGAPEPILNSQESVLANLLLKSGVQPKTLSDGQKLRGVTFYNLTGFDANAEEPQYLEKAIHALSAQDALILVSAGSDPTAKKFSDGGLSIIDVTKVPTDGSSAVVELADNGNPRPIRSVYTGMVPLIYKTQRQLLLSLKNTIFWALVFIAGIMMVYLRSAVSGIVSMLPNMFPVVVIFGAFGWLGVKVDIGTMMCASVALGVAIDNTMHFLSWFKRGTALGLDRVQSVVFAYDNCAMAMIQTAIIGGLGLIAFTTSSFMPTHQFGYLMISILTAALVGDLLILPALLAGPLGYYFGGRTPVIETATLAVPGTFTKISARIRKKLQQQEQFSDHFAPVYPDTVETVILPVPPIPAAPIAPVHESTAAQERMNLVDGPHADLHARLRNLRRESSHGRVSS